MRAKATVGLDEHFVLSRPLSNVWTQLVNAFNKGIVECLDSKIWKRKNWMMGLKFSEKSWQRRRRMARTTQIRTSLNLNEAWVLFRRDLLQSAGCACAWINL